MAEGVQIEGRQAACYCVGEILRGVSHNGQWIPESLWRRMPRIKIKQTNYQGQTWYSFLTWIGKRYCLTGGEIKGTTKTNHSGPILPRSEPQGFLDFLSRVWMGFQPPLAPVARQLSQSEKWRERITHSCSVPALSQHFMCVNYLFP